MKKLIAIMLVLCMALSLAACAAPAAPAAQEAPEAEGTEEAAAPAEPEAELTDTQKIINYTLPLMLTPSTGNDEFKITVK